MIDISVIVVTYNTLPVSKECVGRILKSKGVRFELIIVDNNSKDDTVSELIKLTSSYKYAKIINNSENVGFAKAVNQGLRISEGEHKLLINSDAFVKPDTLRQTLDFVNKNPEAGVVGISLVSIDGKNQQSVSSFPTVIGALKKYLLGKEDAYSFYSPKSEKPLSVDVVVGAYFLITKAAFERVGFMDEKFFMYYEDIDYCKRVRNMGLKVYYLPGVKVNHIRGYSGDNDQGGQRMQYRRLVESSKIYHGYVKHYLINAILWIGQKIRK